MKTIEIPASEIKVGDVVRINAQCYWEVVTIVPGAKMVEVVYRWHKLSTAPNARPGREIAPYKHRLTTKLKVTRGN